MKIVGFETFPVSVPYMAAERSARVNRGGVTDIIVKLTTDSGMVGWGEACSGADAASIVAALAAMAPYVLGRSPWESEAIARDVYGRGLWAYRVMTGNFAFAGIDMALWDLCGKISGQPIYNLFGGAMRQEVNYKYYLSRGTVDEVTAQCLDGVSRDYSCYYLKVGVDSAAEELMLEAVRAAIGPHRKIRLDANEAWTVPQAVGLINRWHERFDLDFVEAPVRAFPHSLMRDVRQRTAVGLSANEGLSSEADVQQMIAAGTVDVLCFSSYWVGSLRRFHTLSQMAAMAGISVMKHTHGELGIAAAAGHHMMLNLSNVADGVQQTAAIMADDILTEALPIKTGPNWGLITGPGLGVSVDEDKLHHFHEAYLKKGQFLPNDA
jgi:L-alanine-DL-glutamate epimerase-like enolase superfamily enzyme